MFQRETNLITKLIYTINLWFTSKLQHVVLGLLVTIKK